MQNHCVFVFVILLVVHWGTATCALQELRSLPASQHLIHLHEYLLLLFQTITDGILILDLLHFILEEPLVIVQACTA